MGPLLWSCVASVALLAAPVWPQQLGGTPAYMSYPGVEPACLKAMNTSIDCPRALGTIAERGGIAGDNAIPVLCIDSCLASLQNARSAIAGACGNDDTVVVENVAYPDNYLLTYSMACRKDKLTKEYCDPQILSWSEQGFLNSNQTCSDCWLGAQALQLSNPLGYDAGLAKTFASLTASCNATTGYALSSPTHYALNSTATTLPAAVTATHPPTCTGSYTVKDTDDCNSVASSLNVSTYDLLIGNGIDIYCRNFAATIGSTLCVPPRCNTYTWRGGDTCASVVLQHPGTTIPQFLAWNANLNQLCNNGGKFDGYQVCVSPPGGYLDDATPTNLSVTDIATTAQPVPTNAADKTTRRCGHWYTIWAGDTCGQVSVKNTITLTDFYFLNPDIDPTCANLKLDIAYCVEAVGDIATYSGYTPSQGGVVTVPPASFSSVNTAVQTATQTGYSYTESIMPTASGTFEGCTEYINYDATVNANGDCRYIASVYGIATDRLLQLNPSLGKDLATCGLQDGKSYCIDHEDAHAAVTPDFCQSVNDSNLVGGTSPQCSCYTTVQGYYNRVYLCRDLQSDYSVTAEDLASWNTWLHSDCDANLYKGMTNEDTRPVCIGINASAPVGTATDFPSGVHVTASKTDGSTGMGPTASGEATACAAHYTVRPGDTCTDIEALYSISFTQLYQWNPSIGESCENLWLGYAYCVEAPASGSEPAARTISPPRATQSSITSECSEFYVVVSGDSCTKVEAQFDITFADVYRWNPAIGSNCENLWVGYAICVAVT